MNRTPLRYPGGKQKLTPFIADLLEINNISGHYVEPYAGGAGVALDLLINKNVDNIHLNDSDKGIYSFWYTVKHYNERLCREISAAYLTIDEWKKQRYIMNNPDKFDTFELGYSVFYLNRCNRSGVLKAGVIGGLDQSGNYKMDARFSRNDLIRRIELIGLFSDNIHLSNFDAEYYINNYLVNLPVDTLVYFDPPYYNKAKDLYLNSYKYDDHYRLSLEIQNNVKNTWVLSYDGVTEITSLYNNRRHFLYDLQYSASRNYKGKEIFIFCDTMKIPVECSLKFIDKGLKQLIQI